MLKPSIIEFKALTLNKHLYSDINHQPKKKGWQYTVENNLE